MNNIFKSYLGLRVHLIIIFLLMVLLSFSAFLFFLIVLLVYILLIFIFRKKKYFSYEEKPGGNDTIIAPLNGVIADIRTNISHPHFGAELTEIRVVSSWMNEGSIILPMKSEIKDMIVEENKRAFRYRALSSTRNSKISNCGIMLELEAESKNTLGLQLIPCPFGLRPELYIMPGDRGDSLAPIGSLLLGGQLFVYLPKYYEILVSTGQKVVAGQTLIAGTVKLN